MTISMSAPIIEVSASHPDTIHPLMTLFRSPDSTPKSMQNTVHSLTEHVVKSAQTQDPSLATTSTTLIPILRGALPMLVAAQPLFPSTSCLLARCSKQKATRETAVEWLGREPRYPSAPDDGRLVVLDTIVATGDTILRVCDEIVDLQGGRTDGSAVVLCCYAAPEALERVAKHPLVGLVVVAHQAEHCDDAGYLVPYTHGDIGDKLFGATTRERSRPLVAVGQDQAAVKADVEILLAENGGPWQLTADGTGIERDIQFKTFKGAWSFMQRIAEEAAKYRHHPEWSNIYNRVSIRWTTHQPRGLTDLDVTLARVCDEYSKT